MEAVTLSKSSWHARYYRWIFGTDPSYWSICPYFWTMLFLTLIFPVIALLKGTGLLAKNTIGRINISEKTEDRVDSFLRLLFKAFTVLYIGGASLIILGFLYIMFSKSIIFGFTILGILAAFILGIFIFVLGALKFFESDTFDLIAGMFVSLKEKVCPALIWKP